MKKMTKNTNSRAVGDKLEKYVTSSLNAIDHIDQDKFKQTPGSGSVFSDGDITNPYWVIECKVRNTQKSFGAPGSDIKRLRDLANMHGREWAYIVQNSEGKRVAVIDFELFVELLTSTS